MTRIAVALALLLGSCAAPPSGVQPQGPAQELAGRVAGAPQRCVTISSQSALRVADGDRHLLLYGSGRTVWANPLAPHCTFGSGDVLVTEPMGSLYCRGDIVRSFDRLSGIPGPACVLGDFIPYNRH